MTLSIFDILAFLPSGLQGPRLTLDEFGAYLQRWYNTDVERDRAARHTLREQLYRDDGCQYMELLIDRVFQDPTVRALRKQWVRHARFTNPLRRITHELATVYTEPAKRLIDGPTADTYQRVLEAVRMDERALEISRLLNLHRALVVGFRVRVMPDGSRQPVLDIASPANARAVMHPNDDTLVVGWMIRTSYRTARLGQTPYWTLWTEHESIQLRDDLSAIGDTYHPHGLGVCPWVPVTLGPPAPGFWPGSEGEDLVAAHVAIWFNNILLLKESKSATKQGVLQGEGVRTARGQAADTEVPNELQDGQSVTTVDLSMDLSMFRETADHVLAHAGLDYGLPPAVLGHQGVQSAEARNLMRIPLKELRRQQQIPLRRFEAQLAIVMARVLAVDLPSMAFDASTWRIEFQESETPLDPKAEHDLFLARRAAGLDNTITHMQRLRPGITDAQAYTAIEHNITVELARNLMMRPLQQISGSLGANNPDGSPKVVPPVPNEPEEDPAP